MDKEIQIDRSHYQKILAHLGEVYPLEGCGLLAGKEGRSCRLYPIQNILHSPTAFEMDPQQQLQAMLDMEEAGWEMLAIYHSHPLGPELPSQTDVANAYYPDAIHIIVSLADRERPVIRAFSIVQKVVDEILLKIL